MSLLEVTSRANFLIYNYIRKILKDEGLAATFKKGVESISQTDLVIFKGLEDLPVILQNYYSSRFNAPVNSTGSCTAAEEKIATSGDQPDSNGNCRSEKKKKKKKKPAIQCEDDTLGQDNPVPEDDPLTVVEGNKVHQVPAEADSSQSEKKKRKKKRLIEVEPGCDEQQLPVEEASLELNGDSTAVQEVEGSHDAPKKKRKKHNAEEASGDICQPVSERTLPEANHVTETAVILEDAATEDGPKKKRKKQKSAAVAEPETKIANDSTDVCVNETTETTQPDEDSSGNGKPDGVEKKASKHQKRHNQPFRRVREEEVVNKHFHDNSFEAKPGATNGWGYKANEDLKPTQGRSFRHEKTKKKRGSYKGGVIDTGVSSFKFESDSE